MLTRRAVLIGSASLAFAACGGGSGRRPVAALPTPPGSPPVPPSGSGAGETYRNEIVGYGPLERDPAGLFDLPRGFSYQILSRFGEPMDDGFLTPSAMDGMGAFDLGGGRIALVRNHELSPGSAAGPAGTDAALATRLQGATAYDGDGSRPFPGGTTTIVYDNAANRAAGSWLSLAGTIRNCAGGTTPWGSWLTCEETVHVGPKPHGYVFEVPAAARGLVGPVPLRAMGRFNHEAALVDPASGVAYLTEDREDGLFYRFLPARPGRLAEGGRLQAMALVDGPADTRNWSEAALAEGAWRAVRWIDLEGVDSAEDDLRRRGREGGAAIFARGEGIHLGSGELYFTCTSGGPRRLGQVMRYAPSAREGQADESGGRLQLFSEPDDPRLFAAADNIAVSPWSHLYICEDKGGPAPVNHLKALTPDGRAYTVGRNPASSAELAGVCFSPDGGTMFLNIYAPGLTLAVRGPWRQLDTRPA